MTPFDGRFVDLSAYQPPSKWEARLHNLLVLLVAGMLLFGGWMFKDWMQHQFRYLALDAKEMRIPYPPAWTLQPDREVALRVLDPTSPEAFPAREEVRILPLPTGQLEATWPKMRAKDLDDYVELERRDLVLPDGRPALLLEYAFTEKTPGATPLVAVRAIDLAFPARYEGETRLVVVTLAAETDDWPRVWPTFRRVLDRLAATEGE